MIKEKTVFILGAGASKAFGYPTGIELREIICKSSRVLDLAKLLTGNENEIKHYRETIAQFRTEFFRSGRYSIDDFLESRQEHMRIGKMAIAQALIPFEKEDNLHEHMDSNWYMYLFERLKAPFDEFDKNNVSFITFNYDRSLEQFMFISLKNSFSKKPDKECAQKVSNIPIVHLYGQLGPLPWQNSGGDSYNPKYNFSKRIRNSKDDIRIIHEEGEVEKSEHFQKAYNLISNANQIYFLGFGYSSTNLKRLKIELMKDKFIYGTAFNLENSKRVFVSNYFNRQCRRSIHLGERDQDVLIFLKDHLQYE